jgi:hypothetical protein
MEGCIPTLDELAAHSPYQTRHIKRFGNYEIDLSAVPALIADDFSLIQTRNFLQKILHVVVTEVLAGFQRKRSSVSILGFPSTTRKLGIYPRDVKERTERWFIKQGITIEILP